MDKVSYYLRVGKIKSTFVDVPITFSRHMKSTILFITALLSAGTLGAQELSMTAVTVPPQAGRIYRTEVLPYDTRHDAEARAQDKAGYNIAFRPTLITGNDQMKIVGTSVEIPYIWTDGNTFLHLENVGSAYTLWVNDRQVADVEDPLTPAEFALTPYIKEGRNEFKLILRPSTAEEINNRTGVGRKAFAESFLYYQDKRSIRDFTIGLVPDSTRKFGVLDIRIIAQNTFNYDEKVSVGFDIYSPDGKLQEFNIKDILLPGKSIDTVHFHPFIYHTYENKWTADGKLTPPLYKVMLFTRRNGIYKEYMPMKIGFGKTEWINGRLMRLGKELKLVKATYNAAATPQATLTQLKALKAQGKNTVCPDYPQPAWFYQLCDQVGLYVIDRANLYAPAERTNRMVGGTPSNDPKLADEYLERVKAMYYRSRNFTSVIAFSLGGPSGNGYNMYKAYEWLKSVEKDRPVIYEDADGEWNTDI